MQNNKNTNSADDAIRWMLTNLTFDQTDPCEFVYDNTASQSGRRLPVIYQPFDPSKRGHFVDRGQVLDFVLHADGGRVLDFGPGDGWPSLLMAPMVKQITGVEGCNRRTDVCTENARRLGLTNVEFICVEPGKSLPFEDESFDAVVAASSVEQTPDPKATLAELYRVLRPGGRFRIHYESLSYYSAGKEHTISLWPNEDDQTRLIIFDRHVDQEYVNHFGLALRLSKSQIQAVFERHGANITYAGLTSKVLQELASHIVQAGRWTTQHPSCRTWLSWLEEVGFSGPRPTYDGGWFTGQVFDRLPASGRPADTEAVDEYLQPLVTTIITMQAPSTSVVGQWDHWISARK